MFTIIAAFSPSKETNLSACFFIALTFWSSCSLVSICLISVLPDGSPIAAVPPPIKIIGLWPAFWSLEATINATKWPICILSAVGSIPI